MTFLRKDGSFIRKDGAFVRTDSGGDLQCDCCGCVVTDCCDFLGSTECAICDAIADASTYTLSITFSGDSTSTKSGVYDLSWSASFSDLEVEFTSPSCNTLQKLWSAGTGPVVGSVSDSVSGCSADLELASVVFQGQSSFSVPARVVLGFRPISASSPCTTTMSWGFAIQSSFGASNTDNVQLCVGDYETGCPDSASISCSGSTNFPSSSSTGSVTASVSWASGVWSECPEAMAMRESRGLLRDLNMLRGMRGGLA